MSLNKSEKVMGVVLPENTLVEEVINPATKEPYLLVSTDAGIQVCDEWISPSGVRYHPMDVDFIDQSRVSLPELDPIDHISNYDLIPSELHKEIRLFIRQYVDLDPLDEYLVAAYAMHTWVYDRFEKVPYLRFIGLPGTGKSRALRVLRSLCYRSMLLNANLSDAGVFRSVGRNDHGTLLFDEMNMQYSGKTSSIVKVLNGGYERGSNIVRCEGENYLPKYFDPFGPKIISHNQRFHDEALESRLLSIKMHATRRTDINEQLTSPDYFKQVHHLQRHLLSFRLRSFFKIDMVRRYAELDKYSPRTKELYIPILRSQFCDTVPSEIAELVQRHALALSDALALSPEGMVKTAIVQLVDQGKMRVYPGQISNMLSHDGFAVSSRMVGETMNLLGLRRLTRDSHGIPYDLTSIKREDLADHNDQILMN